MSIAAVLFFASSLLALWIMFNSTPPMTDLILAIIYELFLILPWTMPSRADKLLATVE